MNCHFYVGKMEILYSIFYSSLITQRHHIIAFWTQQIQANLPLSFFIAQIVNFPLIVTTPLKTSPNAPSPNFSLNSTADLGSSIQLPRSPITI